MKKLLLSAAFITFFIALAFSLTALTKNCHSAPGPVMEPWDLQGRLVVKTEYYPNVVIIHFSDNSKLTVSSTRTLNIEVKNEFNKTRKN